MLMMTFIFISIVYKFFFQKYINEYYYIKNDFLKITNLCNFDREFPFRKMNYSILLLISMDARKERNVSLHDVRHPNNILASSLKNNTKHKMVRQAIIILVQTRHFWSVIFERKICRQLGAETDFGMIKKIMFL